MSVILVQGGGRPIIYRRRPLPHISPAEISGAGNIVEGTDLLSAGAHYIIEEPDFLEEPTDEFPDTVSGTVTVSAATGIIGDATINEAGSGINAAGAVAIAAAANVAEAIENLISAASASITGQGDIMESEDVSTGTATMDAVATGSMNISGTITITIGPNTYVGTFTNHPINIDF